MHAHIHTEIYVNLPQPILVHRYDKTPLILAAAFGHVAVASELLRERPPSGIEINTAGVPTSQLRERPPSGININTAGVPTSQLRERPPSGIESNTAGGLTSQLRERPPSDIDMNTAGVRTLEGAQPPAATFAICGAEEKGEEVGEGKKEGGEKVEGEGEGEEEEEEEEKREEAVTFRRGVASLAATDSRGWDPFFHACYGGHIQLVCK